MKRSYDGRHNNLFNTSWGAANTLLLRRTGYQFAHKPRGGNPSTLPSPRLISNLVFGRILNKRNQLLMKRATTSSLPSAVLTYWGQFLDHDITLASGASGGCELFNIPIPKGDPVFDPASTGTQQMSFCRTSPTASLPQREQFNTLTAYIDASQVYGSTNDTANALRTFSNGPWLPCQECPKTVSSALETYEQTKIRVGPTMNFFQRCLVTPCHRIKAMTPLSIPL